MNEPKTNLIHACSHPSWDEVGVNKIKCAICGCVGTELRYLFPDLGSPVKNFNKLTVADGVAWRHEIDRQYTFSKNQVCDLILTDPAGGRMVVVSDLENMTDGSMRFEVANQTTGRRFGVVLGLTELTPLFEPDSEAA